jgi:spermidine synthase
LYGLLGLQIVSAAILMLLPATLMGAVMPLVLMWAARVGRISSDNPSRSAASFVGLAYGLNTLGALAGSVLTAFLLIPGTSTRFTVYCAAALCLLVGGMAYYPRGKVDRALARSLAAGVTGALILAMFFFWPRLNVNALSTGAYDSYVRVLARSRGSASEKDTDDKPGSHQLLMFEEGRSATVSVRRDWDITSMAINGRTNASDKDDMPTQITLGHLGVLNAPRAGRALIVGFATGITAGSVLQSPFESVDVVEIERAAVASSRFFEHINNRPLNDPRLHLIIDDARTYLRVNPLAYDMIVSEPSHPWVPGVANLFTREFFELGRSHLKADGIFVQWMQIYQLSTDSMRSVLATFHETFPHVLVFRVEGAARGKDLILIGSNFPVNLDRMNQGFNDPRTRADLARVGIKSADDLRAWLICDENQLDEALKGSIVNTDDNMHVETVAPREAFRATMEENAAWLEGLKSRQR